MSDSSMVEDVTKSVKKDLPLIIELGAPGLCAVSEIRILHDPPLDGPTNMAREEALLMGVDAGTSLPTFRLYQWDPPTISLGYFQPIADYEALPPPAGELPVVRRPTGGGAILHDRELTYSLALPLDHPLLARGPLKLYGLMHEAVTDALRDMDVNATLCGWSDGSSAARGPFFCFARRHRFDLLVGTEKIAGSAQRRSRRAVLQHGSIVLANRFAQQHRTAQIQSAPLETAADAQRSFRQNVRQLRARLERSFAEVVRRTIKNSAAPQPPAQSFACEPGRWSDAELRAAEALIQKYASPQWNRRV